jgi:hypothetical protein
MLLQVSMTGPHCALRMHEAWSLLTGCYRKWRACKIQLLGTCSLSVQTSPTPVTLSQFP